MGPVVTAHVESVARKKEGEGPGTPRLSGLGPWGGGGLGWSTIFSVEKNPPFSVRLTVLFCLLEICGK